VKVCSWYRPAGVATHNLPVVNSQKESLRQFSDMNRTSSAARSFRFSVFEADLRAGELRKNGVKVKLQDQPFQILGILLENPGELVSREDLRQRLWPSDTFVDFDHSLNSAVKKLRQALSDDADTPRFVETVPRRGYRFIAPVQTGAGNGSSGAAAAAGLPPDADQSSALATSLSGEDRSPTDTPWHRKHWKLGAAALAGFLLALGMGAWFGLFRSPKQAVSALVRLVPLTNTPWGDSEPSFSPDGNEIAFTWDAEKHYPVDIYIKQIGTENSIQITKNFGNNFLPAWSPDGRYIAFVHSARNEKPGFYIVPALGGTPRKLLQLPDHLVCKPLLSWSPDGKRLAYSYKTSAEEPCAVYALSIDTLESRRLSTPPSPSVGDDDAQFSPDGKSIAFVRDTKDVRDIYVMPSGGGEPHRLTFDDRLLEGIAWMPDSQEILFSSNRGGAGWGLWRIPFGGGTPQRAAVGADRAQMPVVSLKGHRLAYSDQFWNENIWRIPVDQGHHGGKPEKLIYSTLQEEGPQYSPDGKHIVFQSTRSGSFEIWRCDPDGSHLVQLTSFNGPLTGTPRWSPDGRQISFDTRLTSHPNIYVISADGGPPRRFRNDSSDDGVASWSGDGKWLYFASDRSGVWQVWKMPVEGGSAVQITKNGGFAAFESPDHAFLYYTKFDSPGIFRVPADGGAEVKILDDPPGTGWGYFGVVSDGIYFAAPEQQRAAIKFFDFRSQKITTVAYWEKQPFSGAPGMGVSPDGRWILYVQLDEARNHLMLADNFR